MALFKQNKTLSDLPSPPKPDFKIHKPDFDEDFPKYTPSIGDFGNMENNSKSSVIERMPKISDDNSQGKKSNKPIFVKVEKYDEAIDNMNSIREKVKEVENILENLKKIKREEDQTLEEWKESLNEIKEKLMIVDKNLFD